LHHDSQASDVDLTFAGQAAREIFCVRKENAPKPRFANPIAPAKIAGAVQGVNATGDHATVSCGT
jgi:hypothetical protein